MARVTILQTAKAGYASRQTLYRKVKSGDLAVHEEGGTKLVEDLSETLKQIREDSGKSVWKRIFGG